MHNIIGVAARLTDADLLRRVELLAGRERQATAELIGHLAELDKRKLYLGEGYASLFSYCRTALHLSEQAAYKRIVAARASRRFPVVLEKLIAGCLNLSTLCLLAPILTDENCEALLNEAKGRSKREVEVLVARYAPRPDARPSIRRLPAPAVFTSAAAATARSAVGDTIVVSTVPIHVTVDADPALAHAAGRVGQLSPGIVDTAVAMSPATFGSTKAPTNASFAPPPHRERRPAIVALTPERFRIQFTVSRETEEKLRRVQDLLRREIPDGDPAAIFERALTMLLDNVTRRKLATSAKPRPGRAIDLRSRHVRSELKQRVWLRDGGQCAFVARSGRRCAERSLLEFHHVEPYAVGGETTAANLSLRCRSHNAYEAELVFGAYAPATRRLRGS